MESPQQLDLPSWHMLYSSDLEEERLWQNSHSPVPHVVPSHPAEGSAFLSG